MRSLYLSSLVWFTVLVIPSCTPVWEPPGEELPFPTIQEGDIGFVFYHNLQENEYAHTTREAYRDSILDYFGETRTIGCRRSPNARDMFQLEIPTITQDPGANPSCNDYNGLVFGLYSGDWFLVDLESEDGETVVGFFTAFDYGQTCEPFWIPFPK